MSPVTSPRCALLAAAAAAAFGNDNDDDGGRRLQPLLASTPKCREEMGARCELGNPTLKGSV